MSYDFSDSFLYISRKVELVIITTLLLHSIYLTCMAKPHSRMRILVTHEKPILAMVN